jgi:hypothetical protein
MQAKNIVSNATPGIFADPAVIIGYPINLNLGKNITWLLHFEY